MTRNTRRTTFSHVEAVIQNGREYFSQQDRVQDTAILHATSQFATFVGDFGRYKAAEELCRRAFGGRRLLLGKKHPHTFTSMNNLPRLLQSQGKYDEAKSNYRQTLNLKDNVLAKEYPDTGA